jgi:hypothetical protein
LRWSSSQIYTAKFGGHFADIGFGAHRLLRVRLAIHTFRPLRRSLLLSLGLLSATSFAGPPPLPALNIDIGQTSISGISSGGFMAVQFQVAHSSIVRGVGVVAGGPYYCSQDSLATAITKCSCAGEPTVPCAVTGTSTDVPDLVTATQTMYGDGLIDAPTNVANQKVVTLSGAKDTLVPPLIARQLSSYYTALGLPAASLSAVQLDKAAHTMPTLNFGIACAQVEGTRRLAFTTPSLPMAGSHGHAGTGSSLEPVPRDTRSTTNHLLERDMNSNAQDRLVLQVTVVGGLIALLWLPW